MLYSRVVTRVPTAIRFLSRFRRPVAVGTHAALVSAAWLLSFLMRFDIPLARDQWAHFLHSLPLVLTIRLLTFHRFHLYEGMWRYVSLRDFLSILKAASLSSLLVGAGVLTLFPGRFPTAILVLDWTFCLLLLGGSRIAIRAALESSVRDAKAEGQRPPNKRALLIGAGDAAAALVREIHRNRRLSYEIVGLVDDDPRKQGRRIHGVCVLGPVSELPQRCASLAVDELLLAIPSATKAQRHRIIAVCRQTTLPVKTVPSVSQLFAGKHIGQLEDLNPEDVLGRQAVRVDSAALASHIKSRCVMVTGAGGSIGSELCRQIAKLEPSRLLLYERAESALYFLELDLRDRHPALPAVPVVGDILDESKLEEVMSTHAPDVVYHAAAYKHVPLMEDHPLEAIENNVLGTEAVAQAARRHGAKKFVLVSTDKAVRPVAIMGMTKRVAEDLLRTMTGGETTFVSVRFGNVLGSNGSVLPLFQRQIARGGPVTVTHPEATRYFMLIAEAAQLVLQAGAMGTGGEVFFLDMGAPVRIRELAESVIRLCGLAPGTEMPLATIGLRAGERLREELVLDSEELVASEHEKIFVTRNSCFDPDAFRENLELLRHLVKLRERDGAVEHLRRMSSHEPRPGADSRMWASGAT